jgi:DNA adenine methylase
MNSITKPILKWVGGKTQIMDKLIAKFPADMNNYREIFLGGGSVLFTLLSYIKMGKIAIRGNIYAYDVNESLIYMYKNIQTHHSEIYTTIQTMIGEMNDCGEGIVNRAPKTIEEAKMSKENYYYWLRAKYNKLSPEEKKTPAGSALFILLNKTCFRGIYRVGPNGFNVPYGHYKNPEIINKDHLDEVHELIKNVQFECLDFENSIQTAETGDYVYLDPPYVPETQTSFVGYTENGFNIDKHNRLFALIHGMTEKNINCMMSNSDVELVRKNFENGQYKIESVLCKRTINSKNPESKTKEVIIQNY